MRQLFAKLKDLFSGTVEDVLGILDTQLKLIRFCFQRSILKTEILVLTHKEEGLILNDADRVQL
jgi:hypothetical protein